MNVAGKANPAAERGPRAACCTLPCGDRGLLAQNWLFEQSEEGCSAEKIFRPQIGPYQEAPKMATTLRLPDGMFFCRGRPEHFFTGLGSGLIISNDVKKR